jgi:hypothetical protein
VNTWRQQETNSNCTQNNSANTGRWCSTTYTAGDVNGPTHAALIQLTQTELEGAVSLGLVKNLAIALEPAHIAYL